MGHHRIFGIPQYISCGGGFQVNFATKVKMSKSRRTIKRLTMNLAKRSKASKSALQKMGLLWRCLEIYFSLRIVLGIT